MQNILLLVWDGQPQNKGLYSCQTMTGGQEDAKQLLEPNHD